MMDQLFGDDPAALEISKARVALDQVTLEIDSLGILECSELVSREQRPEIRPVTAPQLIGSPVGHSFHAETLPMHRSTHASSFARQREMRASIVPIGIPPKALWISARLLHSNNSPRTRRH